MIRGLALRVQIQLMEILQTRSQHRSAVRDPMIARINLILNCFTVGNIAREQCANGLNNSGLVLVLLLEA